MAAAAANQTAGTVTLAELLALPIANHFEQRFSVQEVAEALQRNGNDVLATMRDLSCAAGPSVSAVQPAVWSEDSELVVAISLHFGNHFDKAFIARSLLKANNDVLAAMRELNAAFQALSPPLLPRPRL